MASLYVYRMQVLPVLNTSQITEIDDIVQKFIWNDKRPKIKLSVLKANREDGGLGLVDMASKHQALLYNWVNDCFKYPIIGNLAQAFLGDKFSLECIWKTNLKGKDSKELFPGSSFWHRLLHSWHDYNYHDPQNLDKVKQECLTANSHIRVRGQPVTSTKWIDAGIKTIADIVDDKGAFLDYLSVMNKYTPDCSWLDYTALVSAIPGHWKFFLRTPDLIDDTETNLTRLLDVRKYLVGFIMICAILTNIYVIAKSSGLIKLVSPIVLQTIPNTF